MSLAYALCSMLNALLFIVLATQEQSQHWLDWRRGLRSHRSVEDSFGNCLELSHNLGITSLAGRNLIVFAAHKVHHVATHRVDNGSHIFDGFLRRHHSIRAFHLL